MYLSRCANRLSRLVRGYHKDGKIPELTPSRYDVKRFNYAKLTDKDVSVFERILTPSQVLTADLQSYNVDFLSTCRGDSKVVLRPKTTEEVSAVLKHCNERKLAVSPQGIWRYTPAVAPPSLDL